MVEARLASSLRFCAQRKWRTKCFLDGSAFQVLFEASDTGYIALLLGITGGDGPEIGAVVNKRARCQVENLSFVGNDHHQVGRNTGSRLGMLRPRSGLVGR